MSHPTKLLVLPLLPTNPLLLLPLPPPLLPLLPAAPAFCGWYMTSFSHARRVIDAPPSLPVYNSSVAYWNDTSGDCMSMWALSSATSYL